jgi:FkbM family methyltransferase
MRGKLHAMIETLKFDNRWQLLAEELFNGKSLRVYRLHGVDAIADHRTGDHLGGIRAVLASSEYRCLLQQIPLDTVHTVMDLGAHVGGFTLLLKTLQAPLERVICVEPNPVSRIKLQFNLAHNGVSAEVFAGAVANEAGVAKLHFGKCSTGFTLLPGQPNLDEGSVEVETVTFDMLLDRFSPGNIIDICKMDVEGAEFEILLGEHAETLSRCRYLICEIHAVPQYSRSALIDSLAQRKFTLIPARASARDETVLFRNECAGAPLQD